MLSQPANQQSPAANPAPDAAGAPLAERRRWPWLVLGFVLTAAAVAVGVQRGPLGQRAGGDAARQPAAASTPATQGGNALAALGDGFVAWETRRSGAWRIWRRDFAGSAARQISPDDPGRNHCCAQISPDGSRVAYLSLPADMPYGEAVEAGELRLMASDGTGSRAIAKAARTYGFGHRAVVWRDNDHLAFIAGDGPANLLDLGSGALTPLAPARPEGGGWLVNASSTHATSGTPTFSPYDRATRTIAPQTALGGCEPTFSHDGRFGIWVAGAGGPLYRMDLASRVSTVLLEKNDARLGAGDRAAGGAGYVYFPMLARSGDALVFGASADEHDHDRGDYNVYVAEVDPDTLEIVGTPLRATDDPGSDRYPDVHLAPLALGRRHGEAPVTLTFDANLGSAPARWDYGDGTTGDAARHTYEAAGSYAVEARLGTTVHRGRVTVTPARPPRPLEVRVRGGRELTVLFDEPIEITGATAALASGRALAPPTHGADDRSLAVALLPAEPALDASDSLTLAGVKDRAERPNLLPPTVLEVPAPVWPSDRRGLTFLWAAANQPNLVRVGDAERAWAVVPSGSARLDHLNGMALDGGGLFTAEAAAGEWLATAAKASNSIGLELTLEPARRDQSATIISFARAQGEPNLVLEQRGAALILRLLTARDAPEIEIARLPAAGVHHLAISYAPGELLAWLDGEQTLRSTALQRDFFRWRPAPLRFGADARGSAAWAGALRAIAIYERRLRADEVAENHRRLVTAAARTAAVPRLEVLARRIAVSQAPTLAEIAPYRQALVTHAYAIEQVAAGESPGERIAVAHWALLDGAEQPEANAAVGERVRLVLEPYASNPQTQSDVVKNSLPADLRRLPLFLDVGLD